MKGAGREIALLGRGAGWSPGAALPASPGSRKDNSEGGGSVCVSGRPRELRFHVSYLLQGSVFPFLLPASLTCFQSGCRGQRVRDGSYAGGPKLGSGGHNYTVTIQKTEIGSKQSEREERKWLVLCLPNPCLKQFLDVCFLGCILYLLSLFLSLQLLEEFIRGIFVSSSVRQILKM